MKSLIMHLNALFSELYELRDGDAMVNILYLSYVTI